MLSIIEAAGWPIWFIIVTSVVALAIIGERFWSLRSSVVAPKEVLPATIREYQGKGVTLPQLDGMIDLAKLSSADALRLAAEDAAEAREGAAERLATIYHMAIHLGMDGQLRSTRAAVEIGAI